MKLDEAARELGRLTGRTTAGARSSLERDPEALHPLIDRAAEPERGELLALQQQLRDRTPKKQSDPAETNPGIPEADPPIPGPNPLEGADKPQEDPKPTPKPRKPRK